MSTSVRNPFGFLDGQVVRALRRVGVEVVHVSPGPGFPSKLARAVRMHRPHFILSMLGCRLKEADLQAMRRLPIPTAVWYTDDPYAVDDSLRTCRFFDVVFTNERTCVGVYQQHGCQNVVHLPLAAPYPAYAPLRTSYDYWSRICLLGSAFDNRLATVQKLMPFLSEHPTRLVGPGWRRVLKGKHRGNIRTLDRWVSPMEACRYYNGADIALNVHRSPLDRHLGQNRRGIGARTPNNRTFEIAVCATFQLTDKRKDLDELYEPGREIGQFETLEECLSLIDFYLRKDEERSRVAQRAYERTLREHLYEHRMIAILGHLFPRRPFRFRAETGVETATVGKGIWHLTGDTTRLPGGGGRFVLIRPEHESVAPDTIRQWLMYAEGDSGIGMVDPGSELPQWTTSQTATGTVALVRRAVFTQAAQAGCRNLASLAAFCRKRGKRIISGGREGNDNNDKLMKTLPEPRDMMQSAFRERLACAVIALTKPTPFVSPPVWMSDAMRGSSGVLGLPPVEEERWRDWLRDCQPTGIQAMPIHSLRQSLSDGRTRALLKSRKAHVVVEPSRRSEAESNIGRGYRISRITTLQPGVTAEQLRDTICRYRASWVWLFVSPSKALYLAPWLARDCYRLVIALC
ncbi:CgeB family protein [Polycladomyces subterraneus]|uniref:Glycosyltransferase n=1 Tax=Polycladomyces subterraneus TaxID=1016997 RepID=A0ABT8IK90_9BACL|nr:glycosyltransferase [Polycladomyces subterraneus]MDN4593158.1 glycosyltransferase [Polycladomyces subterraneus]